MKPVTVSVDVERPREQVFDYIDVLANREAYLNHMFVGWKCSGPRRGKGAKARARVNAPLSREFAEFELVESVAPERTVEESVSAHGKRKTRGTYSLAELPDGGTRVSFELDWLEIPRTERMGPPLARRFQARALGKGLKQLKKALERK